MDCLMIFFFSCAQTKCKRPFWYQKQNTGWKSFHYENKVWIVLYKYHSICIWKYGTSTIKSQKHNILKKNIYMNYVLCLFTAGSNQPPRFLNYFFSTYLLIYEDMPIGKSTVCGVSALSKQSKLCFANGFVSLFVAQRCSVLFFLLLGLYSRDTKRDVIIDTDSDSNGCLLSRCVCALLFVWWIWHVRGKL